MALRHLTITSVICAAAFCGHAFSETKNYSRHQDYVLGTSFDLIVRSETEADAGTAEKAALAEIRRLEKILSTYDENSEITRLNQNASVTASPELVEVLSRCEAYREQTENRLSCRIAPLLQVWQKAEQQDEIPDSGQLRILAGELRRASVRIDVSTGDITRSEPIVFNVNALAKGYIIDAALKRAHEAAPGAEGLLLNIGGDIAIWGKGAHNGLWTSSVPGSSGALLLSEGAIATSGAGPRSRHIQGREFSHIIAPADGWPVDHVQTVSVIAPDAFEADAFATLLNVLPVSEGLEWIENMEGFEARITASDTRVYETSGWTSRTATHSAKQKTRNQLTRFQLDFEIPEKNASDYERPYIAAWIADGDRNLIRILMLAGDEPRWMEENYYWFRRFGRKAGSLVDTESGPTRKPGQYTLEWDGRDHDGNIMPAGEYILHLEAAREHGGHQHESISFRLGDPQSQILNLPAGEELGPVTLSLEATS